MSNSNSDKIITDLCSQWASTLALNVCHSLEIDSKTLEAKIPSLSSGSNSTEAINLLKKSVKIMDLYKPQVVKQMLHALNCSLLDFAQDPIFPKIFSLIATSMHDLFVLPYTGAGKAKALHTDQVIQNEKLTPFEDLEVYVFSFLSQILTTAASDTMSSYVKNIQNNVIPIIFRFLEHDQPNGVRTAAGQIVAALSVAPQHCNSIIELFWNRFSKCKKDEDFRNFSSLIDGMTNLSLSLDTPEYQRVAIGFFKFFLDNAKKIERGVLRLKFLEALTVIIKNLSASDKAAGSNEYAIQLNNVWTLIIKWSTKSKHTPFCYTFLQGMLTNTFPSFFVNSHGQAFLDMIIKYSKNEPDQSLVLLVEWMKSVPNNYVQNGDFQNNMKNTIFPFLFPMNKDNVTRSLKYKTPNYTDQLVEIVAQIAIKQNEIYINFVNSIFNAPTPQSAQDAESMKKLKMICIKSISSLAQTNPKALTPIADRLSQFTEPLLLQKGTPEFENVLPSFPAVMPKDQNKLKQIIDILYEVSFTNPEDINPENNTRSAAFSSLTNYLDANVSLDKNLNLPVSFITKSVKGIALESVLTTLNNISFLLRLADIISKNLSKSISDFPKIKSNGASVTAADIKNMLVAVTHETFPLLISPDKSNRDIVQEFIVMFNTDVFNGLAKIAFEGDQNYFSLPLFVSQVSNEADIIKKLPEIPKENKVAASDYFDYLLRFWKSNEQKIDPTLVPRICIALSYLCCETNQLTSQFSIMVINKLKENPLSPEFLSTVQQLSSERLVPLCQEFSNYMSKNNLSSKNFWPQIVTFYVALSNRPEFKDLLTNSQFDTFMKLFVAMTWKNADERPNPINLTEKALKTVCAYIDNIENKQVIDNAESPGFIKYIVKWGSINTEDGKNIPSTAVDVILSTLHRILSYAKIEKPDDFLPLREYLIKISSTYSTDERIQLLVCRVLSDCLISNPTLLKPIFALIFSKDENLASHAILAIGNAYQAHDDFGELYQEGHATIFATTILHITNEKIKPRQSAFKLMCLMLTRKNDIFTTAAPLDLMMPLTSPSPTGYQIQAHQFGEFASTAVKPESALTAFRLICDEMNHMSQNPNPLLDSLVDVSPILAQAEPLKDVILTLIRISSQCDNNNIGIALSNRSLWVKFSEAIKSTQNEAKINELLQTVFEYGSSQEDIKSMASQLSVTALSYIFLIFPEKTTSFLLPLLLDVFKVKMAPLEQLDDFFTKAKLTFTPTKPQIISANALSQIFLMIEDNQQFKTLFSSEYTNLLLVSIFIRSEEMYNIGTFHPLLESLLDAALFRFSDSTDKFSSNLKSLQEANLITRATTLDQEYRIITEEGSSSLLAYDEVAIQALVFLFTSNIDPSFYENFFGNLLALAFQIDPDNQRTSEPFLILMHIGQKMTTTSLFYIILYTLYCVRTNKTQMLDCVVDCIRSHVLSDILDVDDFETEVLPTIIVFILYLSMKLKQSQSLHIMKVLYEIIDKVIERLSNTEDGVKVFQKVVKYLDKFNGDEYIASVMTKFIFDLKTFGDTNCEEIIKCLSALSKIYGNDNNWCALLADLSDGSRYFIGECGGKMADRVLKNREFKTPKEFANLIYEVYKKDENSDNKFNFVISFICNILCTSASLDLNKESAVLIMLQAIIEHDQFKATQQMTENLIKFLSLISTSCDEKYKMIAAPLIVALVRKSTTPLQPDCYSYIAMKPKFQTLKMKQYNSFKTFDRTLVDPSSLPQFGFFNISGIEKTVITDLWDFVTSQIDTEGEIKYISL